MNAPTSFGLGIFLRIVVPGVLALLVLMPLFPSTWPLKIDKDHIALWLTAAATLGISIMLLDTLIYRVFEGRMFWPKWLRDVLTQDLERLVRQVEEALIRRQNELEVERRKSQPDPAKVLWLERDAGIIADELLNYPWTGEPDRRPHAIWPTRFGNVQASWEYYPETIYGMDSSFYWYRLWLLVDENVRKEIDIYQSYSQALLYICAVTGFGSLLYGFMTILAVLSPLLLHLADSLGSISPYVITLLGLYSVGQIGTGIIEPSVIALRLYIVAILLAVLFRIAYSLAITQHRVSGEMNKSLFDLYRDELVTVPHTVENHAVWKEALNRSLYLRGERVLRRAPKK